MPSRSSRLLRLTLIFNLGFSVLCAVPLLVAGSAAGTLLGPFPGWLMTGLGIGLLGFAGLIGLALRHLRAGWALLISGLDLLWVISTLPLAAIPGLLTDQGQVVVVAVAAVVALACILQLTGIRAMFRAPHGPKGTYLHCIRLTCGARPDALWPVVRDLGSISRYSTSLKSSTLEGENGPAPGAVRVCTNMNNQRWAEEVVSIDDDARKLVLRFRTEAEDFPFPFAEMTGGWSVSPAEGGSAVDLWWSVRPRHRYFGWLLFALMTVPLEPDVRRLVAAMEAGGLEAPSRVPGSLPSLSYC